jgi:peptide/nickel transport system permease protein
MTAYIIRRLLILPVIVFGVTLLIFAMLMLLSPVERASLYVSEVPRTSDDIREIIDKYGLDDPLYLQYWRWIKQMARGDFGWSKTAQMPVLEALVHYAPVSLELALWSFTPMILIGIWLGIQSAVHHNAWIDHIARFFSIIGWSFPSYVFGLLMIMVFYAALEWLPPGRLSEWARRVVLGDGFIRYTRMNTVDALLNLRLDVLLDALRHLVLPVVTLSYVSWALILRITRTSTLEALRQDYVTTARSKGLRENVVINRHVRPNALMPVVTIGGLVLVGWMSGVVATETVFNIRGMGWFFATAALQLDMVSVLGFTLFNGVLLILGNLVVDILYGFIDPRVRLE